ncbi:Glycosyltransferase family protein 64 protein C5 [Rhodotorula toruloides]|nr:Glycosyltransferase family protein 64 protein C5 [Rhodotorula toruloides]
MPPLRLARPLILALALTAALYTLFHSHHSTTHSDPASRLTLVLAAYETDGLRPQWLKRILDTYASAQYADLVARIVLVWNRPGVDPPAGLPKSVKVVRAPVNSLNNRWTLTRGLVKTPGMVVTDNDLVLSKPALKCLHRVWQSHPTRLIGPFVRRRDGSSYVLDELVARPSPYNFVLPRALVGSTELVGRYAEKEWEDERRYVDEQEAHCDDILLNLIVGQTTRKAPLRVALPPGSIGDFATYCSPLNRPASSGLADQSSRAALRTECLAHFMTEGGEGGGKRGFGAEASPQGSLVAVCSDDGESFTLTSAKVGLRRWRAMSNLTASELCPDLAATVPLAPPPHALSPSRSAVGEDLAEYCPEVTKAVSEWIDVLESDQPLCAGTGGREREMEVEEVRENARYECGAWCIWDLRLSTKSGWRLRPSFSARGGMCFERFEDGHRECDEWWYQRPRFDL